MRKVLIGSGVVIVILAGLFFWLKSIASPPLIPWGPPPPPRAYCAKKIERIKVVHFIPGKLNKPVSLDQLDPEFLRLAKDTLAEFWTGEIVVVKTNNAASALPLSDREMALVLTEYQDEDWQGSALLFNEPRLISTLEYTSRKFDQNNEKIKRLLYKKYNESNHPREYSNLGGIVGIQFDVYQKFSEEDVVGLNLFFRSLKDLISGRCDRIMSFAVDGPDAWRRENVPVGEF